MTSTRRTAPRAPRALSLIEVVVVIVILGLLAAFAIPRLGRASDDSTERQLTHRLAVLRLAIEMYRQDHGAYPGRQAPDAQPDEASFVRQLIECSDEHGALSLARDQRFRFGPYLRDGLPPSPLRNDPCANRVHVVSGDHPLAADPALPAGWVYNADTGFIVVNSAARDATGAPFASY